MLIRKSSQKHNIRLYKNTRPGVTATTTYDNGDVEVTVYPSRYDYFVIVDDEVVKRSNSFNTAEDYYIDECAKEDDKGHGPWLPGKVHLVNTIATTIDDYPTNSNTKAEIKEFYDSRSVKYNSKELKAELLSRITEVYDLQGHLKGKYIEGCI